MTQPPTGSSPYDPNPYGPSDPYGQNQPHYETSQPQYDPYQQPYAPGQGQYSPYPQSYAQPAYAQPSSGMALASMIVGIASIVCGVTAIAGPVAVILSIMGIRETGPGGKSGRGYAITGLVTGILGTLLLIGEILYIVLAISVAASSGSSPS